MMLMQNPVFELSVITLIVCSLSTSVFGGKLSILMAKDSNTDLPESTKNDVTTAEVAAIRREVNNKFSLENAAEEDDHDIDGQEDESETALKNAMQPAADPSLSIWGIVGGLWSWIKDDIAGSFFGADTTETHAAASEGRTFGKIRRLQMALIPIVFKFGVLSAMIGFLVAVGVKTLFLVKVLVVMNLLALLAKFFTFKNNFGHVEHFSAPPAPMWSPYVTPSWHSAPEDHHINKEIHLHIHGGHPQPQPQASSYSYGSGTTGQTHGWEKRNDPYIAYDNIALQTQQNELISNELPHNVNSVVSNKQQHGRSFPENHRMF